MIPHSLKFALLIGYSHCVSAFLPILHAEPLAIESQDWNNVASSITEDASKEVLSIGNGPAMQFDSFGNSGSDSGDDDYESSPYKNKKTEAFPWASSSGTFYETRLPTYDMNRATFEESPRVNLDLYAPLPNAESTAANSSNFESQKFERVNLGDESLADGVFSRSESLPFGWSIRADTGARPTTTKGKRKRAATTALPDTLSMGKD